MRYSIKDYSRTAAAKGWGAGWPTCAAKTQTAVVVAPISGVKVVVHKRIARLVYLLIAETERRGYLLRPGQCWGGNCRAIAGTSTPSNHSWWLAVDLNSLANPYVVKKFGRPVTDMPTWLPLLWNAFGFAWGGDYSGSRADAMHLEFMGSPEDADDMTALAEVRFRPTHQTDGAWVITDVEDDMYNETARQELLTKLDELDRKASLALSVEVRTRFPGELTPGQQVLDAGLTMQDNSQAPVRQVLADSRSDIIATRAFLGPMLAQILAAAPGVGDAEAIAAAVRTLGPELANDVASRLRITAV